MRIAYIIPVHTQPEQVTRLLHRLATDDAHFVLHVDRRATREDNERIVRGAADLRSVVFLDRHRCYWGGFGVVRAVLKGIDHLVGAQVRFDYAVLLSGQDYPLRSPKTIERVFEEADGQSFMGFFALPRADGWGQRGGLDRVEDWHLVSRRAVHLRLPRPRSIPGGHKPFGGGRNWCLARPVVEFVDRFVKANPRFVGFFEHTLHPSELFFQTVIMSSPFAATIVDDHLCHIAWAGGPSPVTFTAADFEMLVSSRKLFARKFDERVDSTILDLLDAHIDHERARVAG